MVDVAAVEASIHVNMPHALQLITLLPIAPLYGVSTVSTSVQVDNEDQWSLDANHELCRHIDDVTQHCR
jgi:hypothetical protein